MITRTPCICRMIEFKRKLHEKEAKRITKQRERERGKNKRNEKTRTRGTIAVHLSGNVQKISLHYKTEREPVIGHAVQLNSTSLEPKLVGSLHSLALFYFLPLPLVFYSPFFFNTTSPFAIGSTKNCGTSIALFVTRRLHFLFV